MELSRTRYNFMNLLTEEEPNCLTKKSNDKTKTIVTSEDLLEVLQIEANQNYIGPEKQKRKAFGSVFSTNYGTASSVNVKITRRNCKLQTISRIFLLKALWNI